MEDSKKIKKIALIEPGERVYNLSSFVKMPKLGLPILGDILRRHGYDVIIFVEKIAKIDWREVAKSDCVGISVLTQTALESYEVADKVSAMGIPAIMGGPHVTFLPDEALKHCDYVVRGEGEVTLLELLNGLNQGKSLDKIRGLSYKTPKGNFHNPSRDRRKDISYSPDFTLVHGYNRYLRKLSTKMINGGVIPLSTSRGCPHTCSFCSVTKMFGRKYRALTPEEVVQEIKQQIRVTGSRKVFLVDDNFAEDKKRAKEILKQIIQARLDIDIVAQIRINAALDEELLLFMNRANLRYVLVGFESINPRSLDAFNKRQRKQDMVEAIQKLHRHKIHIHGMFIVGTDNDKSDIVRQTLQFSTQNRLDTVQFLSIMPLPGTQLYDDLLSKNKLLTRNYSLYNGHYVVNLPDNMKPSFLQKEIILGHKKFFGWKNIFRSLLIGQGFDAIKFMLVGRFLSKRIHKEEIKHIQYLYKIEKTLMDGAGNIDCLNSEDYVSFAASR